MRTEALCAYSASSLLGRERTPRFRDLYARTVTEVPELSGREAPLVLDVTRVRTSCLSPYPA